MYGVAARLGIYSGDDERRRRLRRPEAKAAPANGPGMALSARSRNAAMARAAPEMALSVTVQ